MRSLLPLLLAGVAAAEVPDAPPTARTALVPQAPIVPPIVISERFELETAAGKLRGEHELRFPAPPVARLRSLKVGGRVSVPAVRVSGATSMSAEDGPETWERRYAADPKGAAGAVLTITRAPAGFVLSTGIFLEAAPFTGSDPRDANHPQALRAACAFVLAQGVSFLVETLDPARLGGERGAFSADGEWSETRRCRGRVTALLGSDAPAPGAAPAGSAQPAP